MATDPRWPFPSAPPERMVLVEMLAACKQYFSGHWPSTEAAHRLVLAMNSAENVLGVKAPEAPPPVPEENC